MGKATTTAVTYEAEAIRNAREYAGDAARRAKELEARVVELEAVIQAVHRHAKDISGERTFDQCSNALMYIDDICRGAAKDGKDE